MTTTVYIKEDPLALTLAGSKRYPSKKQLLLFAKTHCGIPSAKASQIIEEVADAITGTMKDIRIYRGDRPSFKETGEAMLKEWECGVQAYR